MDFSIEHLDHSVGWMESILSIVDQLLEGSHHAEAMFWLEQVLPSHSHSVEVLMRWAALSIELEEWETASSAYQSVLKILPTCRPALTGLLRAGAHLGDGIDHLPAFTQAFGGNSLTQYETLLVVQTLLAMRCKNEALQTLKGIGELQVEDSHAYLAYMQIANQLVQSDPCADSGQMASDIAGRVLALPVANAEIFSELLHFVARQ